MCEYVFICIFAYLHRQVWVPVPLRIFSAQSRVGPCYVCKYEHVAGVSITELSNIARIDFKPWKWPTAAQSEKPKLLSTNWS